jgi:hypothetical protein
MKLPPKGVWIGVLIATALGILALVTSPYWEIERYPNFHLKELGRDIGIAFIVAAVVSLIYEWNTRSIAEKENMLNLYNNLMSANVSEEVWEEVNKEIFQWPVRRSNIKIRLKVMRDFPLSEGRKKTFSPRVSVLWMQYEYDLYRLAAGKKKFDVTHILDYFFERDTEINVPRFERVIVTGCDSKVIKDYQGTNLAGISNAKGSVELVGNDGIALPSLKQKQYVRITTERYEFVNTPGFYLLVMPELVVGKIKITIEELPEDLEAEVIKMDYHEFLPEKDKNVWNFDGVMLPGQFVSIGFTKKEASVTQHGQTADTSTHRQSSVAKKSEQQRTDGEGPASPNASSVFKSEDRS